MSINPYAAGVHCSSQLSSISCAVSGASLSFSSSSEAVGYAGLIHYGTRQNQKGKLTLPVSFHISYPSDHDLLAMIRLYGDVDDRGKIPAISASFFGV